MIGISESAEFNVTVGPSTGGVVGHGLPLTSGFGCVVRVESIVVCCLTLRIFSGFSSLTKTNISKFYSHMI